MKTTERFFVYFGLAASLLIGLAGRLSGGAGSSAVAAPSRGADVPRIASVDVLAVVERLASSDKYKADRAAASDEQVKKLQPLTDELKKLQDDAKDLKEESEKFKQLAKDFGEKNTKFQQMRSEVANQVEVFNTKQVGEAYRLVIEAAVAMADKSGYTHVLASKGGPVKIASQNIPGAVQEMLARPLIKGIAADDLTDRLIKELKLEGVVVPAGNGDPAGVVPPVAKPVDAAPPTAPEPKK